MSRRMLPYFTEFVRFCAGFALILALALISLHFATAAQASAVGPAS